MLLSSLYLKDFVEFELKHPVTGAPTGAFVTVSSAKSERYRAAQAAAIGKHFKDGVINAAPERIEAAATEALAGAVINWRGLDTAPDEPLVYSPEAAVELLSGPKNILIKEQIEKVVLDITNFVQA